MNTFSLDKNYQRFDFDEVSVSDLESVSGGTGGFSHYIGSIGVGGGTGSLLGVFVTNTARGAATGGAIGAAAGAAFGVGWAIGSAINNGINYMVYG